MRDRLTRVAAEIADEDKRKRIIHLTCCLLPKVHRDTMEVLFAFLTWVSSFSTVDEESGSKMDIHNIATVIAPNILYSNGKNPGMDDSLLAIEAVHAMIEDNETFCEVCDPSRAVTVHHSFIFPPFHSLLCVPQPG